MSKTMNATVSLPQPVCALCLENNELRRSHIIPKFIWKYLKESAGAGGLRLGTAPDKPTQDGYKVRLLCSDCEQRLSSWEKCVAETVFMPLMRSDVNRFEYDQTFGLFCVSITWRVLAFFANASMLAHLSPELQVQAKKAAGIWRNYLLRGGTITAPFAQHFLPIPGGPATPSGRQSTPPNLNRYLSRSIDMDVVAAGPTRGFVYAKLCRLIVFGFINMSKPTGFVGTELTYGKGSAGSSQVELPRQLGDYMLSKAQRMLELQRNLSARQVEKTKAKILKSADAIANSANFEAMLFDVNVFGAAAFDNDSH